MVMLARVLVQLAIIYGVVLAVVYVFQRHLQYFPDRTQVGEPRKYGLPQMQAIAVTTQDGLTLQAWYVAPRRAGGKTVVYFHGNGGHHAHRASKIIHFIEAGYGVYLSSYRGYGGNPGRPDEQGFYADARAGVHWLQAQGVTPRDMIFYGESIGSGVAIEMARDHAPAIMILEAPFTSAVDVARTRYRWLPVDMLMKDRFDSVSKIGAIKTELLIIHGDEDEVTPIALAQRLFDKANHPKELVTINGGHHADLYEHHAGHIIIEWLSKRAESKNHEQ